MSNQFNKRNYHHQRNNGNDNNTRKNHRNQNRQPHPLAKLHDEFNPPFRLNYQWTSTEHYKLKIPHPFFADEKETVHFPIFKSSPLLAARATFYQHVLDIMNQVQFDGENGPNLYYTFTRCLRQEALTEWYDIIHPRQTDDDRSPANFGTDIDTFIRLHDPRDTSELLQDQLSYINHIFKPRHTKPSVFKNQLLRLNNQILLIPEAEETDKIDDTRIKSIFFSAMPSHWKKEFRKHGNKLSTKSIDELAQYFDIYHNDSTTTRHTHSQPNSNNNNNNRNNNQHNTKHYHNNETKSTTSHRPKADDICPIHGGHTWHFCIFNKDGPNYRPPARNATTSPSARSNENFNGEQITKSNDDNDASIAPYDDEFSSIDSSNEPVPQVITEGISSASDTAFTFTNCLLDSGGTRSLIPRSRLPKSIPILKSIQPYSALSSSGVHHHQEYITLSKIRFPQFSINIWLENVKFIIFDDSNHCAYDIILGRDIIKQFGFIINFAKTETSCLNVTLPFIQRHTKPSTESTILQNFINDMPTETSTNIQQLNSIPSEFPQLFANNIGKTKHYVDLQLVNPHTPPIHSKPYTLPNTHRKHFTNIITDLIHNNVLQKVLS